MSRKKQSPWPIYTAEMTFWKHGEPGMIRRTYTFASIAERDIYIKAAKAMGGEMTKLVNDKVVSAEQAIAELAADKFFSKEPA